MCGRYTLTRQDGVVEEMQATLGMVETNEWWKPRFNVAPTQLAPVVVAHEGVRTLEMMRWGLVPHWAAPGRKTNAKRPPLMINARVEGVMDKPVFRDAFARRRCLVPADGFFEWKRDNKQPLPLYIRPVPRRVVAFAGMWMRAGDVTSFAVLTGPPNALVSPIHDRMPIVLDRDSYAGWLDPTLDADDARALLHVPSVGDWRADYVSTHVNKATNDDPSCITPEAPIQGSLF